jgi:hypothetical protein
MSSSSLEFYSDYILISHIPAKLHLKYYTDNKFPVFLTDGDYTVSFVYWHLIKNRDGESDIIFPMLNNLKYFDFVEVNSEDFVKYHRDFVATGMCNKTNEDL